MGNLHQLDRIIGKPVQWIPPEVLDHGITKKAAENHIQRLQEVPGQCPCEDISNPFRNREHLLSALGASPIRAGGIFKAYIFQLQDTVMLA